nr:hypothetical protein [Tanacetum cinerariifolium]
MVADLRYFNSLEYKVHSLTSQLETQKTQFVNEIDHLSWEYYYADHMNAILGVYTELDEVTNLQCDYLELLQKCECLEIELSKSKNILESSVARQMHCHKKLIEKLKGKSVDTKFEKSSVIRQPNACQHSEQSESVHNTYLIEQDAQNMLIESVDMNYDSEQIDQDDEDVDLAKEWNKNCQSFFEIDNIQRDINTIVTGVELCKQKIANPTYYGNIEPVIKNPIEQNFCPVISRINVGLFRFFKRLNEEMVADLRYFNSLESEVDSLTSQLETQKTQFVNKIDCLSREYYHDDHMNAILSVYTKLDEVTNLQCDYLELLQKCECLKTEL